jgi:hypothetical protein
MARAGAGSGTFEIAGNQRPFLGWILRQPRLSLSERRSFFQQIDGYEPGCLMRCLPMGMHNASDEILCESGKRLGLDRLARNLLAIKMDGIGVAAEIPILIILRRHHEES